MQKLTCATTRNRPYWDGTRILFEIEEDDRTVSCAISKGALEDLGGKRCSPRGRDLLAAFGAVQPRIELLAREKLRARPDGVTGRLSLWSDDIDDGGPSSSAGRAMRE